MKMGRGSIYYDGTAKDEGPVGVLVGRSRCLEGEMVRTVEILKKLRVPFTGQIEKGRSRKIADQGHTGAPCRTQTP